MRTLHLAALAMVVTALAAPAGADVRAFQCRFRQAREAAAVAGPLLSEEGSLEIQSKQNTVVVRDTPEVLKRVADALAVWDTAPATFHVRLRMIMGSTELSTARPAQRLQGFGEELVRLFNFGSYEEIDTLDLKTSDGSTLETSIGKIYRLRMTLHRVEGDANRIQIAPFELTRREGRDKGLEVVRPILRSTVSLLAGQTGILIASRSEAAKRALIVVLAAEREATP